MAKMKAKNVGKGATLITLMSNPMVRRAVLKGANKVITTVSNKMAARSETKFAASSPPPVGQTTVIPKPAPPKPATKPASFAESAAVETIVSSVASAAKPYVDKLASSDAGRSVLQVVNSVTGQALGGVSAQPKRGAASVASFVGNIISGQVSSPAPKPEPKGPGADVKFTQVKPPSATAEAPAPKPMQWPPPKSNGSAGS